MKVNFRIERLVVEGASQAEGRRVAEALQEHLAQLARTGFSASGLSQPGLSGVGAEGGVGGRSIRLARLDGGSVAEGAGPEEIGRHIAGKIAGQIAGPGIGRQVFVQAGGRRG